MESSNHVRRAAFGDREGLLPRRPRRPPRALSSTYGEDLHLHRAGRNVQPDRFPCAVSHEGLADGRFVGDPALGGRGFRRADDDVLLLRTTGLDHHVATDLDGLVLGLLVDDLSVLDHLLEREDPAFEERLIVLCLLELRVLREVAELHGGVNPLGHALTAGGLQVVELGLDLLQTIRGDVDRLLKVVHWSLRSLRARFPPVRAVVMKSAEGRRPSALNRRTLLFRKLYVSLTFSATLRRRVLSWYRRSGRDLPWRHTRDPYRVL